MNKKIEIALKATEIINEALKKKEIEESDIAHIIALIAKIALPNYHVRFESDVI